MVLSFSALYDCSVVACCVLNATPTPTAVLTVPVVFAVNDSYPIAVLLLEVLVYVYLANRSIAVPS